MIESLDWLPKGWNIELRTRETGDNAITTNKVFTNNPVSQLEAFMILACIKMSLVCLFL